MAVATSSSWSGIAGAAPLLVIGVAMAMALEASPPRLVRGMVERWFPALPFISTLFTRCGLVVFVRE